MNTTLTYTLPLTEFEYMVLREVLALHLIELETEHAAERQHLSAVCDRPDADPEVLDDLSSSLRGIERSMSDVQALQARLLALSPVHAALPEAVLPCPVV